MTIEAAASEISYAGNGVTVAFAITFPFDTSADIRVFFTDSAGTPSEQTTGFSISGGGGSTGTCTFTSAPAIGVNVTLLDDPEQTQPVDYISNDAFPAETHEKALDRVTRLVKRLNQRVGRSIRVEDGDDSSGDQLLLPIESSRAGKYLGFDASGQPAALSGTGADSALRTDLASSVAGSDGARLSGYRRTEAGAVASAVASVLRRTVWIEDFGGAPGAGDNSAAFNAALTALIALGGGRLQFGTVGEWRMNVTVAADNIVVVMPKGRPEFDVNCIRPFNIATGPAITFGTGLTNYRYCGLENVSMSGTNGTAGADVQSAKSAAQCLLLKGGMISFLAHNSYFYNGIRTVSLEPSATNPVTGTRFIGGGARNDLTDSALARTIYGVRVNSSPGFYTDNVFSHFKLNGPGNPLANPTLGYLAEFDGTASGLAGEFDNCYVDCKADFASSGTVCHGILLKGSAQIRAYGLTLDPGAVNAVVIETDQALGDIGRYVFGEIHHGGQKMKFAAGAVIDIPNESDWFTYRHRLHTPTMTGPRSLATPGAATAYPTSVQWELQGAAGPDRLTGADLEIMKDLRVQGSSGILAAQLTSVGGSGGAYLGAGGVNQNVKLVPTGAGRVEVSGADASPAADNVTSCARAASRWSVVYAATGAINTSDKRAKADISDVPQEWLDAWGDVQWQRYRFKDAIAAKGDGARWHVGLIAQRVIAAFTARGLDALKLGIVCFDEWPDEFEDVREEYEVEGKDGPIKLTRFTGEKRLVRAAGNLYALRYEEALAMECAYLRSKAG